MKIKTTLLSAFLLSSCIFSAQAEIIETDYLNENDGLATLDTSTGLEWLDLSQTSGMSYNQVKSLLDTTYAGWRLPTLDEVTGLMQAFFPDNATPYSSGYTSASRELRQRWADFMGHTNGDIYAGWHAKSSGSNVGMAGARSPESRYSYIYLNRGAESANSINASYGVFLVSDGGTTLSSIHNPDINTIGFEGDINASVPVSLSGGLLALGLLGLRRKIK